MTFMDQFLPSARDLVDAAGCAATEFDMPLDLTETGEARPRLAHGATREVAVLTFPDAQILDVVGPLEVFARASRFIQDTKGWLLPPYSVEVVAKQSGPVRMSNGVELVARRRFDELGRLDTLLIAGGMGCTAALQEEDMIEWIGDMAGRVRRIASICTGACLLAAAGMLKDRSATTHWAHLDELKALEPTCRIEPDSIFVRDGNIYSSAGVTAGMDLALALVEEDLGRSVALAVAQAMVMYVKRPGGQTQFSRHLEAQRHDERFGALHIWMLDHLSQELRVEDMAREAGMSSRHFSRKFVTAMGRTPAAYLLELRVEHARRRIAEGATSLKKIAIECGFGSEQSMRRAFAAQLRVSPSDYKQRFAR